MYSFGQNKYGKLGLHYANSKEGEARKVPIRISMYKQSQLGEVVKAKQNIVQTFSGSNHSMALSDSGKIFTWGYRGRGLLGRQPDDPRWAGLGIQVDSVNLRVGLTMFQKQPLQG